MQWHHLEYLKLTRYSPLQREVIAAVVEGQDVFLQASTSFGKSLCYQLPAIISHGGWSSNSTVLMDVADLG